MCLKRPINSGGKTSAGRQVPYYYVKARRRRDDERAGGYVDALSRAAVLPRPLVTILQPAVGRVADIKGRAGRVGLRHRRRQRGLPGARPGGRR